MSVTDQGSQTLASSELDALDAWWRAANYLSVGQIYLLGNPLLTEPLRPEHVKPRLLGHWGTTPGLNMIYVHLNRVIRKAEGIRGGIAVGQTASSYVIDAEADWVAHFRHWHCAGYTFRVRADDCNRVLHEGLIGFSGGGPAEAAAAWSVSLRPGSGLQGQPSESNGSPKPAWS